MIFLATVFPVPLDEDDDDPNAEIPFDFLIEFYWKYIQNSFEANISLLHHITLAALVWLWTRREIQKSVVPVLLIVGLVCSYKGLILDLLVHNFALGTWTALVYKAVSTFGLTLVTLQMYVGMTSLTDKY